MWPPYTLIKHHPCCVELTKWVCLKTYELSCCFALYLDSLISQDLKTGFASNLSKLALYNATSGKTSFQVHLPNNKHNYWMPFIKVPKLVCKYTHTALYLLIINNNILGLYCGSQDITLSSKQAVPGSSVWRWHEWEVIALFK